MHDGCAHSRDHPRTVPEPAAAGRPRAAPPITGVCGRIPFKVRAPAYAKECYGWFPTSSSLPLPYGHLVRTSNPGQEGSQPVAGGARVLWTEALATWGNARDVACTPWAAGPCDRGLLVGPRGGRLDIGPQLPSGSSARDRGSLDQLSPSSARSPNA